MALINALFGWLFSVCIGRKEWAMAPTCGIASRLSHFRLVSMVIALEALAARPRQRAVTKLKVHASAASSTSESSGPSTLILILGGIGRIRWRTVDFVLVLFLLAGSNAAFGGKKAPKLAETIDLPQTFELDFQFAVKQRAQLGSQREVPDDIGGRIGEDL
jgi:hypothetical protein